MNPIFQANLLALINKTYRDPKPKIGKPVQKDSISCKMIEYLFDTGETSGSELIKTFNLSNSPQAYIQPHIKDGRVICIKINHHNVNYRINEHLTKKDFGID